MFLYIPQSILQAAPVPGIKQNFLNLATIWVLTEIRQIGELIMQTLTIDVFTDYI